MYLIAQDMYLPYFLYMVIVYRMLLMFCYKDQWDPGCTTTRHNLIGFLVKGKVKSL